MTNKSFAVAAFILTVTGMAAVPTAQAAPCLIVTLTGTQSGPPAFNGLAGPGTLVRYGDDANNCGAVKLQFDAGRGTNMRLSQVGVPPGQLNAIFFTHMHSDHADGFADIIQLRWHFNSTRAKDRRGLQLRCRIAAWVHHKLQEVRSAYWRCILPVRRDRPAPFREQGTSPWAGRPN